MNTELLKALNDVREGADVLRAAVDAAVLIPGCPLVLRAARPIVDGIVSIIDAADDAARKAG